MTIISQKFLERGVNKNLNTFVVMNIICRKFFCDLIALNQKLFVFIGKTPNRVVLY